MPDTDWLATRWQEVFAQHMALLRARTAPRPLLLLEFGFVDAPGAVHRANADEFEPKVSVDADADGLDDGEQTQARLLQAFFGTARARPGVVDGVFLWGEMMADQATWDATFARLRSFSVRGKRAEDTVRQAYGG